MPQSISSPLVTFWRHSRRVSDLRIYRQNSHNQSRIGSNFCRICVEFVGEHPMLCGLLYEEDLVHYNICVTVTANGG